MGFNVLSLSGWGRKRFAKMSAMLTLSLAMTAAWSVSAAKADVVIDDDFTVNPLTNGWHTYERGDNTTPTFTWDNDTNVRTDVTAISGGGYYDGAGIVTDSGFDTANAQTIRMRLTFGKTGNTESGANYQLMSLSGANPASYHWLQVKMAGFTVVVTSDNQTVLTADLNQQGGVGPQLDGQQADPGDWIQAIFGRDKLESLSYFDASANSGAGNLITLYQDGPGDTDDKTYKHPDFNGVATAYTSIEVDATGSASRTGVWDRVTVETTPVPEPGSLALLGLGGLAMLRRKRRG